MFSQKVRRLSQVALAGVALGGASCQSTHESTVQSFRIEPNGNRVPTSNKVGISVQAPALSNVEMSYRNLSVDEKLAHLQQRLNDVLRQIGRADCVNSFSLECPNVKGDQWIAEGVKVYSPSVTAFLVEKGLNAAQIGAFWKLADQNFGDSFSINNSNSVRLRNNNHNQNILNPGTPVTPPKPNECPNKNGCPSVTLKGRKDETFTA